MTPERWQQIQTLFEAALAQAPGERPAFLERACADTPSLRVAVEDLLAGDARADREGFLEATRPEALAAPPAGAEPDELSSGQRIGPYAIQERIARGGMGCVYRALRVGDYRQEVALKLIRRGAAGNDLLQRFHSERQLLAGLRHPHIARLLDGGTTAQGLPYLVMEYIDGLPLDRWCAGRQLPVRDRLQLFHAVCLAVQYAHEQGVIHRDLKPANVLVAADGSPRVTDFGLAKALNSAPSADGATVPADLTHSGVILGTPSYMAPEQASGQSRAVGPAADVYGLGALFYELLTGRPPFRADTPLKTVFQVLHHEPVPPRRICPGVARDLETICLKCLHKEPARRYASVAALADEVWRFLAGEPIQARPVGRVERLLRWSRRHPTEAGLTAALFLALAGGLAGMTYLWRLAETRGETAQREQAEASRQRDRAREHFGLAWKVLDDYYTRGSKSGALQRGDLQPLRAELLEAAAGHFRDLAAQQPTNAELEDALVLALIRVSQMNHAMGRGPAALATAEEARERAERLAREHPKSLGHQTHLAAALEQWAVVKSGPEAMPAYRRSLDLREQVHRQRPNGFHSPLAYSYFNVGLRLADKPAEALPYLQRARELREEYLSLTPTAAAAETVRSDLAETCLALGQMQRELGQLSDALASTRQGCDLRAALARAHPQDNRAQSELARAFTFLGEIQAEAGQPAEAAAAFRQVQSIQEKLLAARLRPSPQALAQQAVLADTWHSLAKQQSRAGQRAAALHSFRQACELRVPLLREGRDSTAQRKRLGEAYADLARELVRGPTEPTTDQRRHIEQALNALRQAVAHGFRDFGRFETDPDLEGLRQHPEFQTLVQPHAAKRGERGANASP
jgi:tetratricopeptide (TPR) repeat protein